MTKSPLHNLSGEDTLDDSSLLRTLIDDLPDQVYVKDTKGRYLFNNTKHVEALGAASSEEVTGKSDFDFYPKELAERYRADEQEIIRSGQPLICREEPSVDGEGKKRWHLTMKVPLRNGSGEIVVGLIGMTRDVTERKRAEEKLKESEERHRAVVEQSVEGIYLFDPDDKCVLESNSAIEELLGYTSDELLGMTIYDFIAHEREDIDRNVRRSLSERRRHKGERRYRRKDGSLLDVETSATVISYHDGEAVCMVVHDVTERKETEERLRKSEARLVEAQRIARLGNWEWEVKTDEVYWSEEVFRIYGYTPGEFVPTLDKLMEAVHPDDRDLVRKNIDGASTKASPTTSSIA